MPKIIPLRERVLAELMGFEQRVTAGGIIVQSDDGKEHGVRPRWARIRYVGEGVDWVKPGDYVLVAHGRWTRAFIAKTSTSSAFRFRRCAMRHFRTLANAF